MAILGSRPHFSVVRKKDILQLLRENHYIGDQCADPTYVFAWRNDGGLFGDCGDPCAAALFAPSAARAWGARTIELTRLVRHPDAKHPLTGFLSQCIRFLASTERFDLIVSYADPAAGHHGGIYQAGSWLYVGLSSSKTIWLHKLTGKKSSQRSFDQSSYSVADGWEKIKTGKKHTYLFPLTKKQRKQWVARSLPYPKPIRLEVIGDAQANPTI